MKKKQNRFRKVVNESAFQVLHIIYYFFFKFSTSKLIENISPKIKPFQFIFFRESRSCYYLKTNHSLKVVSSFINGINAERLHVFGACRIAVIELDFFGNFFGFPDFPFSHNDLWDKTKTELGRSWSLGP